jgi:carbonic anhydrase
MKVTGRFVVLFLAVAVLALPLLADCPALYGYSGFANPSQWSLIPGASLCGQGKMQSPVDITLEGRKIGPAIEVKWAPQVAAVINSGHDFRINVTDSRSGIRIDGEDFRLREFHFHVPSEHSLFGVRAAAEIHFVHEKGDRIVVIALLLTEAAETDVNLRPFFDALPVNLCQVRDTGLPMHIENLVPGMITVYLTYEGSLTTPPCTEGVRFYLPGYRIIRVSHDDLAKLATFGENARPLQPLNGRTVNAIIVPDAPQ